MRAVPVVLGMLVLATSAAAQERSLADYDLPRDVQRRIARILDDSTTRRFTGAALIASDQTVNGNVVVFDGPLTVAGRIEGELIVIGGNAEFLAGSTVSGDVTVIGGEVFGLDLASVAGTFTSYGEGFELYHRGERILALNPVRVRRPRNYEDRRDDRQWGRSTLYLRTGINYNRVEGLPILFGPVIQTGGHSPTRVEALGIVRSAAGDLFDTERMGYQLRAEQFIGGRAFRIGATVRSIVEPIEAWNLTNLEASLATFVLHDDQRDYFERQGWGAYFRLNPRAVPLDATVGYWDEDYLSRGTRDPWTLFGDGAWRAQPLVAEGRLQALSGRIQYDARNDREVPTSGLFMAAQATHGLSGNLTIPSRLNLLGDSLTPIALEPLPVNGRFNSGLIDLRLYRRLTRDGTLALRGAAGGSLDGRSLPPQFQHALGGAGTLPGYDLFRGDCGARSGLVTVQANGDELFFPGYGCDRFALGSIEYRGGFDFGFGGDFDFWGQRDDEWDWHVDASPNWMLFFNAGKGWALGDSRTRGALDTDILYDAGAGVMLGDFGIYGAVPLNGEDRSLKFFVRLGARF